jgi:hypothetical protein
VSVFCAVVKIITITIWLGREKKETQASCDFIEMQAD